MDAESEVQTPAIVCPNCGLKNVRLSMVSSMSDRLWQALFRAPFRCRACRKRFRRFSRATPPSIDDHHPDGS